MMKRAVATEAAIILNWMSGVIMRKDTFDIILQVQYLESFTTKCQNLTIITFI